MKGRLLPVIVASTSQTNVMRHLLTLINEVVFKPAQKIIDTESCFDYLKIGSELYEDRCTACYVRLQRISQIP